MPPPWCWLSLREQYLFLDGLFWRVQEDLCTWMVVGEGSWKPGLHWSSPQGCLPWALQHGNLEEPNFSHGISGFPKRMFKRQGVEAAIFINQHTSTYTIFSEPAKVQGKVTETPPLKGRNSEEIRAIPNGGRGTSSTFPEYIFSKWK